MPLLLRVAIEEKVHHLLGEPRDLARPRRDAALDTARALIDAHPMQATAGATAPNGRMVVLRVLAPVVEPAMGLLRQVWAAWRAHFWGKSTESPRIWSM